MTVTEARRAQRRLVIMLVVTRAREAGQRGGTGGTQGRTEGGPRMENYVNGVNLYPEIGEIHDKSGTDGNLYSEWEFGF